MAHRPSKPDKPGQEPSPQSSLLPALADLAASLGGAASPDELEKTVAERAAALLACSAVALVLVDDDRTPHVAAVFGDGDSLACADILAAPAIVDRVFARHDVFASAGPVVDLGVHCGAVRSLLVAPLVSGQRVLGLLLAGDHRAERRFTPDEADAARLLANTAAAILDSALQFERFSYDLRLRIVEATKELNRALAELKQIKAFNENVFESIPIGIVVFDRAFALTFRNRLAEEVFPQDRVVLDGLRRTAIADRAEGWEQIVRDVVRLGQAAQFDSVAWQPSDDADPRIITLTVAPLVGARQAIVGGIMTVEDVTRSATMHTRLAASERLAAVGRLAAKVAHELNNPLDGILRYIGLAERVCKDAGDERPLAYLESARQGLMRMVRIISELLEFSRSTVTTSDDGDIRQAIRDAVQSLAGKADQRHVTLGVEIAENVPAIESTSLYQVFTNIIKNAIEAVPEGGAVSVDARAIDGAVEVRIADNGPGIPKARLGVIFEPFFSTKAAGQGTGLGLAICKELIEKQGGVILAQNRPEGGAEFVIRIPTQWTTRNDGPSSGPDRAAETH